MSVVHRRSRRWRLADGTGLVVALAAVAVLAAALVLGSTQDEEELRFAVLSAWLHVGAFWTGRLPQWTPLLGLGIPQPFVPTFAFHPLAPLLGVMAPVAWVRVLLFAHTVAGGVGIWRLGYVLGLAAVVRGMCVATFLLSSPSVNYVLTDFWPSHFVVWTAAPWLLLLAWGVLDPSAGNVRRAAGLLGLVAGLVAVSANPAYLVVWAPLAVMVIAASGRMTIARGRWLFVSLLIAAALAAPTLAQILTERSFFEAGLELSNVTDPLPGSAAAEAITAPFGGAAAPRALFFGGPFAVLAILGGVWFRRARLDLVVTALVSAMLTFTTWVPLPFVSQRYQFRDVLIFSAIPLAALAVNRLLQARRAAAVAVAALIVQLAVMSGGAWPFIARTLDREGRQANAFRGASGDAALADTLLASMPGAGRLLYSSRVDEQVAERAFVPDGLGINALAYRGVPVVNGSFKAVSADSVWPDDRLFYGRVRTPEALTTAAASLDALGIRYVLAFEDEPVATELRKLVSVTSARGATLALYENPGASSGVWLLPAGLAGVDLPVYEGCDNDRVLCRDFRALARPPGAAAPEVLRAAGETAIKVDATDTPATLVVADMFRPGWMASAGERPLAVRPVFGGLIAVALPAGIAEVRLVYQPFIPRAATIAYAIAWLVALGLILAGRPRQPRRPDAFGVDSAPGGSVNGAT